MNGLLNADQQLWALATLVFAGSTVLVAGLVDALEGALAALLHRRTGRVASWLEG